MLQQDVELEVEQIEGPIFAKMVEWCTQHKNTPMRTEEEIRELRFKPVPEWDAAFLNLSNDILCKMLWVSSSNYDSFNTLYY